MPMKILTGYTGTKNVTAADNRGLNRGIVGPGDYVLDAGAKFAATAISANTVRVQDGEIVIQGCHARLSTGETQDLTIDNGSVGLVRHDIIVARYIKNTETGIEDVVLAVKKGTAGATGVDPELTQNDIPSGGVTREVALKRVILTGLTITAIQTMYTLQDTMATMRAKILLEAHPVGSIYQSTVPTSPEVLFGGTWIPVEDRFLMPASTTYPAGTVGGEANHTLTVGEMPSHSHDENGNLWANMSGSDSKYITPQTSGANWFNTETVGGRGALQTDAAGGGQAHNNMPPWYSVYTWSRTA